MERLRLTFRFTYAFHAREVRFECDRGGGFERLFPETFSFHAERHDPAELLLQLTDLSDKPELLAASARRRDSTLLLTRLVLAAPRYLEQVLRQLEADPRLDAARLERVYTDLAVLAEILMRFAKERVSAERRDRGGVRLAGFHLRKLLFVCLDQLVRRRVEPDYLAGFVAGTVDPVDPADDLSDTGFVHALEGSDRAVQNRLLLRLAERAFYRWVEDVCLDEENFAFEDENSPFASRESEVRRAICVERDFVRRGRDLSPYLRRRGNRDVLRLLEKLERWFLRQYDIHHAAAMIHHADRIRRGVDDSGQTLSSHRTRSYVLLLAAIAAPFAAAAAFYQRAPELFDWLCAGEVLLAGGLGAWFLFYRFLLQRNLTLFRAAVPRIMAGIIVGYLPIFFIDEVWSLVVRPWPMLVLIGITLGATTLLYLYIEVQRRLDDPVLALARARQIFLLGLLQSAGIGLLLTGLVGPFMAARNWPGGEGVGVPGLIETGIPWAGQLPVVLGVEPVYAFPSAVFTMAFLSFFIGTFLQLMWEELPITEPL